MGTVWQAAILLGRVPGSVHPQTNGLVFAWGVALGLIGVLLLTAVFNFLVRETLGLVRAHSAPSVPVTGAHEPAFLRAAWAVSALAGLVGAVLAGFVLSVTGGEPLIESWALLPGPPEEIMMAVTTVTACLTAGLLACCYLLFRQRRGSLSARLYYLSVTLAWLALMVGIYFSNLFSLPG